MERKRLYKSRTKKKAKKSKQHGSDNDKHWQPSRERIKLNFCLFVFCKCLTVRLCFWAPSTVHPFPPHLTYVTSSSSLMLHKWTSFTCSSICLYPHFNLWLKFEAWSSTVDVLCFDSFTLSGVVDRNTEQFVAYAEAIDEISDVCMFECVCVCGGMLDCDTIGLRPLQWRW